MRDKTSDVIPKRQEYFEYVSSGVTHVTARETFGICRDCGRDIAGAHESMKCLQCRSTGEEWVDADPY